MFISSLLTIVQVLVEDQTPVLLNIAENRCNLTSYKKKTAPGRTGATEPKKNPEI